MAKRNGVHEITNGTGDGHWVLEIAIRCTGVTANNVCVFGIGRNAVGLVVYALPFVASQNGFSKQKQKTRVSVVAALSFL